MRVSGFIFRVIRNDAPKTRNLKLQTRNILPVRWNIMSPDILLVLKRDEADRLLYFRQDERLRSTQSIVLSGVVPDYGKGSTLSMD